MYYSDQSALAIPALSTQVLSNKLYEVSRDATKKNIQPQKWATNMIMNTNLLKL